MNSYVREYDIVIQLSKFISRLGLRDKVREAKEEIGQNEYGHFVKRLHVVLKAGLVRFVPLDVNA